MTKRIENRFNVWWYILALYISYFVGCYFDNEIALNDIINQLNPIFITSNGYTPYFVGIILKFIIPLVNVGIFELVARVFYGICNTFSLGAITMKSTNFVSALRVFVIGINIVLGLINISYYFFNFLIPLGKTIITFGIMSVGYIMFFLYINKHYLDKKTAHRAFRVMSVIYLIFTFFSVAGGILL